MYRIGHSTWTAQLCVNALLRCTVCIECTPCLLLMDGVDHTDVFPACPPTDFLSAASYPLRLKFSFGAFISGRIRSLWLVQAPKERFQISLLFHPRFKSRLDVILLFQPDVHNYCTEYPILKNSLSLRYSRLTSSGK